MQRSLRVFFIFFLIFNSFPIISMDFNMGTIEIHGIKSVIDEDGFYEESGFIFDEKKELSDEKSLSEKDVDITNQLEGLRQLDTVKRLSTLIGDDSLEEISFEYSQKELNYLWKGSFFTKNQEVYRLSGREDEEYELKVLYDDTIRRLSLSTESIFSDRKRNLAGPDSNPTDSYYFEDNRIDLSGNFYTTVLKGWNLSGRILDLKREIKKEWLPFQSAAYENNLFKIEGQKEFDLLKNIFVNLDLEIVFDEVKYRGMEKSSDGILLENTVNIANQDFSIITRIDIMHKGEDVKEAFLVEYIKYLPNDNLFGIKAGREYEEKFFEDIYLSDKLVFENNLIDVFGNEHDKIDIYYETFIDSWKTRISIGTGSISQLLYYYDINVNDRKYVPAYMNDLDRSCFTMEASKKINEDSQLLISYASVNNESIVPYESENKLNIRYTVDYSENTVIGIVFDFQGEYFNRIAGGLKNDSFSVVDFDFKHLLDEKTSLILIINNLLDEDRIIKPGFSERGRNIKLGIEHNF